METVGIGMYYADLHVGGRFQAIGRTVTETGIVNSCHCTGDTAVPFANLEFLDAGTK